MQKKRLNFVVLIVLALIAAPRLRNIWLQARGASDRQDHQSRKPEGGGEKKKADDKIGDFGEKERRRGFVRRVWAMTAGS